MFDILFDFALLAAFYLLLYRLRLQKRDRRYRVWFTLLYVYLCMVAYVTLMPFQLAIPGANPLFLDEVNLEPFVDIKHGYLGRICRIYTVPSRPSHRAPARPGAAPLAARPGTGPAQSNFIPARTRQKPPPAARFQAHYAAGPFGPAA